VHIQHIITSVKIIILVTCHPTSQHNQDVDKLILGIDHILHQ